jgi:hypothetical protein
VQYKITQIEIDKSVVCFIAISATQEIAGKCSFKIREGNIIRYQDAYVNDSHRQKGIYGQLFDARQTYVNENYPNYKVEAFCRDTTVEKFKKNGFEVKGNLYLVEKK